MRALGYCLTVICLMGSAAGADALTIDHAPGCVVAESFARITARVDPIRDVARARVYFRASGTPHWYIVEMRPEGGAFAGVLPRPMKATTGVDYYIEVLDRAFAPTRTVEHHPAVVPVAGDCRKEAPAALALTEAKVVVSASSGAPPLPPGFVREGMVAASGASSGAAGAAAGTAGAAAAAGGGGVSTAVLVVGAVGVVGAGAAAAVAVTDGGSDGSEEGDQTYEGPYGGQRTVVSTGRTSTGAVISTCSWTSAVSATLTVLVVGRPDGTVSGTVNSMVTETEVSRTCSSPSGQSYGWRCDLTGTPGQLGCRGDRGGGSGDSFLFSGAVNGTSMSGTVVYTTASSASPGEAGQTFTHSGSSTFPVTLTRR